MFISLADFSRGQPDLHGGSPVVHRGHLQKIPVIVAGLEIFANDGDVTGGDGAPDELKAFGRVERDPLVVLDLFDDIPEFAGREERRVRFAIIRRQHELYEDLAVGIRPPRARRVDSSAYVDGEERRGGITVKVIVQWGDAALAPFVANHRSLLRRR